MKHTGTFIVHRQIQDDWKWENPLHRSAWMWILLKAAYRPHNGLARGQLYFSVNWAPKLWGMNKGSAWRFLQRLIKDGSISWKKGHGNQYTAIETSTETSTETPCATSTETSKGIITVLKYSHYNKSKSSSETLTETPCATSSETLGETHIELKNRISSKEYLVASPTGDDDLIPKSPKKSTKKPKSDPIPQQCLNLYHDKHIEIKGDKPHIIGGRDIAIIKRLLNTCQSPQEFDRRLTLFLNDPLEWQGTGTKQWSLSCFEKCIMKYADRQTQSIKKAQAVKQAKEDQEAQDIARIREEIEKLPSHERDKLYLQARDRVKKGLRFLSKNSAVVDQSAVNSAIEEMEIQIFSQGSIQK